MPNCGAPLIVRVAARIRIQVRVEVNKGLIDRIQIQTPTQPRIWTRTRTVMHDASSAIAERLVLSSFIMTLLVNVPQT